LTDKHLHIISFNIPYPPNYGGVIDVFFKIRSLHKAGVKVHLHCFQYGRKAADQLEQYCESVHYYPRKKIYQAIYKSLPYITASRKSSDLLQVLGKDEHPILFEGLHTCAYLGHPKLKGRLKAVRMHNVEWDYYRMLGKGERNFFRKFYYYSESYKLKRFEEILNYADLIYAISKQDFENYRERFSQTEYLPAFHPNDSVTSLAGKGDFALYHGSLGIVENHQAAMFLATKVFAGSDIRLVFTGRDPLDSLKKVIEKAPNMELIENPDDLTLDKLIKSAQINVLPTFQPTGIKLKLLNALYRGRFCLVNDIMVSNTGLEDLCLIANSAEDMRLRIEELMKEEFSQTQIDRRKEILAKDFSNRRGASKLITSLFPHHN
jgi:glycosyltransferase involved in cell wall biosynthesis